MDLRDHGVGLEGRPIRRQVVRKDLRRAVRYKGPFCRNISDLRMDADPIFQALLRFAADRMEASFLGLRKSYQAGALPILTSAFIKGSFEYQTIDLMIQIDIDENRARALSKGL